MSAGAEGQGIYESGLDRVAANSAPLSPISYLTRAAAVYPDKLAVVHGERRFTYREFGARARQLASALQRRGIGRGDCVAIMAGNIPAMLEAHNGVPMAGAVLNPINTRLDARTIAFILEHGEAKVLLADKEFAETIEEALGQIERKPLVVGIEDAALAGPPPPGEIEYEEFLAEGDPGFESIEPAEEWQAICLLYTSGTTGNPKGVVYHHRGAFLNAMGNLITFGLTRSSVYLWTLPMFHCSGWTYTWGVTAAAATHVCLRRPDPALIYPLIVEEGVTHMCGAPIILNMLSTAPDSVKQSFPQTVDIMTGGAAPPSAVIEGMEQAGFRVIHAYGLTETYGPATACAWQEAWDELDLRARTGFMARQGVRYLTSEGSMVADPDSMEELPWDGESMGELMLRGNTVMKGYAKNPEATAEAFQGGWFHSGDLAVRHPDGYIEVKDRAKDVIISGGENISSLEVEEVLYRHPKVLEAAVVAKPDEKWGETPCAFIALRDGAESSAEEIIAYCREQMAHFKQPRAVVFGPLPKTSTGKIQKFVLRDRAKAL